MRSFGLGLRSLVVALVFALVFAASASAANRTLKVSIAEAGRYDMSVVVKTNSSGRVTKIGDWKGQVYPTCTNRTWGEGQDAAGIYFPQFLPVRANGAFAGTLQWGSLARGFLQINKVKGTIASGGKSASGVLNITIHAEPGVYNSYPNGTDCHTGQLHWNAK